MTTGEVLPLKGTGVRKASDQRRQRRERDLAAAEPMWFPA